MDQDENEKAAQIDHEEAQRQLDDPEGKWQRPKGRRIKGKRQAGMGMDIVEPVKNETGKREAAQAGAEEPPPPKCLQLPEKFDLTKEDQKEAATGAAEAERDPAKVKVPE